MAQPFELGTQTMFAGHRSVASLVASSAGRAGLTVTGPQPGAAALGSNIPEDIVVEHYNVVDLCVAGDQDWRWQDRKKARQHAAPSLGRPGVTKDDAASIYVRNLPFHASEADLEAYFCQAGPVVDIRRGANAEGGFQVTWSHGLVSPNSEKFRF